MDDITFNCPHCDQELEVEASAAGSEIECPSCTESIVIPSPEDEAASDVPGGPVNISKNPIDTSAERQVERHFKVPQHEEQEEKLIEKPLPSLKKSSKEGISLCVKTFKRSDTAEVGKDHFDEVINEFLEQVGDENVVSVSPITYSHQDLASRQWISDFGVIILYRG